MKYIVMLMTLIISGCSISYTQSSTNLFNAESKAHSLCKLNNVKSCHVWQCFAKDQMFNNDHKTIVLEIMQMKDEKSQKGYVFFENKMIDTKFINEEKQRFWVMKDSKILLKDNKFGLIKEKEESLFICSKTYTKT